MNYFLSLLIGAILAVHLMSCYELNKIEQREAGQGLSRYQAAPEYMKNKGF